MEPKAYLQKAKALIKQKGRLKPTEIYEELGLPPKGYRLKADGRGSVSIESREKRAGRRSRATKKRSKFDVTSTPLAGFEAKKFKQQSSKISAQAELFGLEPTQIEHLADQADVEGLTSGAPGDPTNLMRVRQSEARYKDQIKLAIGKENAVTLNPAEESLRVIPKKFFDPLADPSTLPGIDVPVGTPIEEVQKALSQIEFKGGKATLNRAALTGLAAAGVAAFGPLGTAASAAELAGRLQLAQQTGDFADQAQAGLAGVSLAGDVASYFPPAAPIGEAVSTTADVANIATDIYREDPERAKRFVREQVTKAIPKPPVVQQIQQVQRAAQAVQRGGKVKFNAGKVQFTLPEFGLSELLGFN